jgi:hypothetical protein
MSSRRLPLLVAAWLAVWLTAWASPAAASPRTDVQKRLSAAMESYDLLEYETAKKLLLSALEIAKDGKLEGDPLVAKVHLSLGIVSFAGLQDKAAARRSFIEAVTIDPKIALDAAYKTPDMSTLLETVRATTAASRPPPPRNPDREDRDPVPAANGRVDCFTISGLQHRAVERARRGAPLRISASLGGDVQAAKVSVFVRGLRKPDFRELKLVRDRDCTYGGTIPAGFFTGDTVHYYVAAVNDNGTVVASSGSAGAPNLIQLFGLDAGGNSDVVGGAENPLDVDPRQPPPEQESVFERAPERGSARSGKAGKAGSSKVLVAASAASGLGYVTGETEQQRNKVQCCIAPGWFTVGAEVGYATSPRLIVSAVLRLGFPVGANIEGHSPLGPAGFARLRYGLSPKAASGSGLSLTAQLGGGIIRNTVKLAEGAVAGMDTDIVALGPVLLGGGVGYGAALTDMVALTIDLTAIAGIPVVSELGTSKLNFGVQVDATVGAALRF